ncbi:hypothetical protein [Paraburkholderia terrae]
MNGSKWGLWFVFMWAVRVCGGIRVTVFDVFDLCGGIRVTVFDVLAFDVLAFALASAFCFACFTRRPCAGRHLLFFAAAKKSRQKKAANTADMTSGVNRDRFFSFSVHVCRGIS